MKKQILGYYYEYKHTVSEQNCFTVKFVCGISLSNPKKYAKFKDYYCQVICSGDYSPLHADTVLLDEAFAKHEHGYDEDSERFLQLQSFGYYAHISYGEYCLFAALSYVSTMFEMAHQQVPESWIQSKIHDVAEYKYYRQESILIYRNWH